MIPDLGRYAVWVLSAYGLSLLLIGALVALVIWRAARVRRQLAAAEARRQGEGPR
ncbi:MAG: heme exporter protein CcmD [Rhodobacteraceae bacterium]|jgi:heme exporter protein D|nr:heme exporter protein CcmD [Paracoccaceae bacterium]